MSPNTRASRALAETAAVMDNPSDLINVGIEQLVRDRIELPAFSALDRLPRLRTLMNGRFFAQIDAQLTDDEKAWLDALLIVSRNQVKSPLHGRVR